MHAGKGDGKLVIINLQGTPLDGMAKLRIWGKVDDVMERLMEKLSLPVPAYKLHRYLQISYGTSEKDGSPKL